MHLTVLARGTSPNACSGRRLAVVLDGSTDVSVSHLAICDDDEAARWRMDGSPTLLIDGVVPFTEPG